jgi:hypothetical protein
LRSRNSWELQKLSAVSGPAVWSHACVIFLACVMEWWMNRGDAPGGLSMAGSTGVLQTPLLHSIQAVALS